MITKLHRTLSAALLLLLFAANLMANNIQLSNTKLTGQNTADGYTLVQFDLAWENSWQTSSAPNNWDAAWVFVKYRVGSGEWQQAWLNNGGHSPGTGTGATIDAGLRMPGNAFDVNTNPAVGVFIYRSADGTGTFSITNAQLRWNYGINGVAGNAEVEIKVFAIEMVYVPEGAFFVGSGADPAETASFTQANITSGATVPFQITSTPPTIQGNNAGSSASNLGARGQMDLTGTNTALLAAGFPTGFAALYSMKYEISQQQYVDFLNTLTYTQQDIRIDGRPHEIAGTFTKNVFRHKIKIHTSGVASTTPAIYETEHPNVGCNFLSWMDGAAYSDWAGLRPMTELEFEKASRGTMAPVANEYAWGAATVANNAYTLNNIGQSNEGIANNYSNTAGNASYSTTDGSIDGPLRVGIFAGHVSNNGRISAGASYYGIMEMSGNVWERVITVGNATGRAFTGVHGDGALSANGYATETTWPGINSGEVTGATGSGLKGGSWYDHVPGMTVSNRYLAAYTTTPRLRLNGFRAVRDAP